MKITPWITLLLLVLTIRPATAAEIFERVGLSPRLEPADLYGSARGIALGLADLTSGTPDSPWSNPGARIDANGLAASVDFAPELHVDDTRLWMVAADVVVGPLRLAVSGRRFDGAYLVRTAFEPDGQRVEYERTDVAAAVAFDATHFLARPDDLQWTVGTGLRRVGSTFGDDPMHALDLGTTLAVTADAGPVRRVAVAGVLLNLTDATRGDDDIDPRSPARAVRIGLGVKLAAPKRSDGHDLLSADVAVAYTELLDAGESWQVGVEVAAFESLVLRGGYHEIGAYDTVSYGLGLRGALPSGIHVEIQWTREDPLDSQTSLLGDPDPASIFGARLSRSL